MSSTQHVPGHIVLRRYLSCRVGRLDGLVAGLEKRSLSVGAFKSSIELSFVHALPLMMSLSLRRSFFSLMLFFFNVILLIDTVPIYTTSQLAVAVCM